MRNSFVSHLILVLGAGAFLIVLVLGGRAHASLEMPWHGPDMHSSLPHPAPGSSLLTVAAQSGTGIAGSIPLNSWRAVESDGFRVLPQLEMTGLDHPPR